MKNFTPGTFGNVVESLGLRWSRLSFVSGLEHTTIIRWAHADHAGRITSLRCNTEAVRAIFDEINKHDRARGGRGEYSMHNFRFQWKKAGHAPTTEAAVEQRVQRINGLLSAAGTPENEYRTLAHLGKEAKSEASRAAWKMAWQRYAHLNFPTTASIPPHDVGWYPQP